MGYLLVFLVLGDGRCRGYQLCLHGFAPESGVKIVLVDRIDSSCVQFLVCTCLPNYYLKLYHSMPPPPAIIVPS